MREKNKNKKTEEMPALCDNKTCLSELKQKQDL